MKKVLHVDLYDDEVKMYQMIKDWHGGRSDADVVRFMIKRFYEALESGGKIKIIE